MQRLAEIQTIADAAAVIHRQHDIATAREVLIQRVGVAVVVHVVPAEQHLPAGTAVEENDGGPPLTGAQPFRKKQLAVNRHAVGGGEDDLLRLDERRFGEVCRDRLRGEVPCRPRAEQQGGTGWLATIAAQKCDGLAVAGRHRRPLEPRAARHRRGRAARHRHAPHMAAIDVALVRIQVQRGPVRARRDVLDFEVAGRKQGSASTLDGHRVEVRPAVLLPREHDTIAGHPQQLLVGDDVAVRAARAGVGLPDLPPRARRDVDDANRPRLGVAARGERHAARLGRRPRERDARAVGGPHRVVVAVEGWIEEAQRLPGDVVHGDEGVIAAVADEGELAAVRRPAQGARRPAGADQLLGGGRIGERRPPHLAALEKCDAVALGGDHGRIAFAQPAHRAARHRDEPDLLLDRGRQAARVGDLAAPVGAAAPGVDDRLPIGRPGEIADFLAVVVRVRGELAALVVGRRGHPDVARAVGVEHPRHGTARRGRNQVLGEWRGQRLLEGERRLLRGEGRGRGERDGESDEAGWTHGAPTYRCGALRQIVC